MFKLNIMRTSSITNVVIAIVCVTLALIECAMAEELGQIPLNLPLPPATELKPLAEIEKSLVGLEDSQMQVALLDLTYDKRREVKVFALEALMLLPGHQDILARAKQMALYEENLVVQGHAKLLVADQNGRIDSQATDLIKIVPTGELNVTESKPDLDSALLPMRSGPAEKFSLNDRGPSLLVPQIPFWKKDENAVGIPTDVSGQGISLVSFDDRQPRILDRPIDRREEEAGDFPGMLEREGLPVQYEMDATLGFAGNSGVQRTEWQQVADFVPIEDRWRTGFPEWDRYEKDFPFGIDYPFKQGSLLDPYNQNVLKGDYPIIGQHTFFSLTATNLMLNEYRQTPTPTTPYESTANPFSEPFFGNDNQYFFANYLSLAFELFHGSAAFKPVDWKIRITPVFNVNHLAVGELAVVNPDVRHGTKRTRTDFALEEWFLEAKLADLSPDYDFMSVRAGSQFFVSDFRGFLFKDINRGVRLFGTRFANRDQFNLAWFDQAEKDTNSALNTFDNRHQNVTILNYFRQDFIFPGFNAQWSFHYNHDKPSTRFDDNDFLVRPDPAGVFQEHQIDAYYVGMGTEGHVGRFNVTSQLYLALGKDSLNPIAGEDQRINAQMAALELSYDRDWIRFRSSYFYASGDSNVADSKATGFDTIFDDPNFAGGQFSYWQRQSIKLFGVNLVQRGSLVPNLRSSKIQGQSNFVNPGLQLINLGTDMEIAPKLRAIANANYLFFNQTEPLKTFTFQNNIGNEIGADLSIGFEYRPFLNDNVIFVMGSSVLLPGRGLKDLYGTEVPDVLRDLAAKATGKNLPNEIPSFQSHFIEMVLTY